MTETVESTYRDLPIQTCKTRNLAVYVEILDSMYTQITNLLSWHSRITVVRIDLHLPGKSNYCPKLENSQVSDYLKMVKCNLALKKWGGHKRVAYGWVREVCKSGHGHYHLYIAFKSTYRRLGAISGNGLTGLWYLLQRCWKSTTGGRISISNAHTVKRRDQGSLANCFHHLSYLAKTRSKDFGTKATHKRYSGSRLTPNQ